MKKPLLISTLISATALSVPAWASGTGTQSDPYTGTITDLNLTADAGWTAGTTVYIDGWSGYWNNATETIVANINIGSGGMLLNNGYSGKIYTFSGSISGSGDWTFSNSGVSQTYIFTGDMSGYSGNIDYSTERDNTTNPSYFHFGNGGTAATDTNVSGTGSITQHGNITFDYSGYATTGDSAITIGNSSLKAETMEFAGSVNYTVSSDLTGYDSSSTLTISNTNYTTTVTGSISGFGTITVGENSTLTLSGSVDLSSAIQNSGTVVVTNTVTFELGNLTANDGVYTFIDGGTITDWGTLTGANFTLDGWDLGRSTVDVNTAGQVTVTTVAAESLTWAGTDGATWSNQGGTWDGDETFYNRDSVTFGYHGQETSQTVNISGSLLAGTIIVSDNYTFVFENGAYVEASYVDVTSPSYTLKLQVANGGSAEFHMDGETFFQFFHGDENHGNLEIGAGVTFYLSDLDDSASFTSASFSLTGTGTLSVEANEIGLYLPDFQGTVEFRSGNARFGVSNGNETGIYNSSATLQFDDGAGITLVGNTSSAVSAKLVFAEGSHTLASGTATGEFSGTIDAANATLTKTGAGTITFSGTNVNIGTLSVSQGNITFAGDATIGTFNSSAGSNSANGSTTTLAKGVTLTVGTLTNAWGANFVLEEGSVLTATSADFSTGNDDHSVSGTGTFKADTFSIGNVSKYTFDGITLEVGTFSIGSTGNQQTFNNVTATIGSFTISSSAPVTFTGGSADIDSISVTGGATITFEGSGEFTIGSYTESNYSTFAIGENTTVTVGTFSASYNETFSFGTDSVLNVTGELSLHVAATETISGGTINAETLNLYNFTTASFSNGTLNIGSGGIISSGNQGTGWTDNYLIFGDGLTVGVYAGADGTNTSWSSDATIQLTGTDTGTTFFTNTDESITITGSISGDGNLTKTGDGTLTVSNYGVTEKTTVSEGTLVLTGETILGGSAEIHVETGATLDLTGVTKTQTGLDTMYDILYIEGGTVTVQNLANGWSGRTTNFGSAMYNGMLQISNGGVLDVTVAQTDADLSGEKRGFAVTSGEGTYRFSGTGTSYIVADGNRTIHLGNEATLIFDVVDSSATLDVSMAIAYGMSTTSDVGSETTSSGSLVKTGAGTLILEVANNYSGGTTIKEGVLVAASSSALGSGEVKIEGGAQLSVSSGVEITNAISVTLSEAYQCVSYTPASASAGSGQIAAYASGDEGIYAITGTGGTLNTTITLFIDDTIAKLLAEAGEEGLSFYLVDISNLNDSSDFTVSLSEALSGYTYTYDTDTGILWVAPIPEPSAFGLFFGLGAIGLVATRRRRRRH